MKAKPSASRKVGFRRSGFLVFQESSPKCPKVVFETTCQLKAPPTQISHAKGPERDFYGQPCPQPPKGALQDGSPQPTHRTSTWGLSWVLPAHPQDQHPGGLSQCPRPAHGTSTQGDFPQCPWPTHETSTRPTLPCWWCSSRSISAFSVKLRRETHEKLNLWSPV